MRPAVETSRPAGVTAMLRPVSSHAMLLDAAGATLASARLANGGASAMTADSGSIWVALANPYDGRLVVWRIFDPGGPLIEIER